MLSAIKSQGSAVADKNQRNADVDKKHSSAVADKTPSNDDADKTPSNDVLLGDEDDSADDIGVEGAMGYFWATLGCVVVPHVLLALIDVLMLWEDRKRAQEDARNAGEPTEGTEMMITTSTDDQADDETRGDPNDTAPDMSKTPCCTVKLCVTCDCTRNKWMYAFRVLLGWFGLGVVVRKLQRLYYMLKSKTITDEVWREWYELKTYEAQRDSSNLAFICAFTENCPQLLLQLNIFVRHPVPLYESIGRSIITSALNLPLAYANYYRTTRRQPKDRSKELRTDLDNAAFLFYYLGILGAVVARVLAIGLFTGTVSTLWGGVILGVHFIGNMIFIHFYQKPPFSGFGTTENKCCGCFSVTVNTLLYSLVNLFIFVDLNDRSPKRWRLTANYGILFVENVTFVILSFTLAFNEYAMIYGVVFGIGCVLQVIMLPNYYAFLHPTVGQCFNCTEPISDETNTSDERNGHVADTSV